MKKQRRGQIMSNIDYKNFGYLQPDIFPPPIKPKAFYNVPNSTASNLVLEVLGAGENIAKLPSRKRRVNHTTTLEVLECGNRRQINLSSQKAKVTIELSDIDKLTGSNKPAKKLFVLALIKANETGYTQRAAYKKLCKLSFTGAYRHWILLHSAKCKKRL